MRARTRGHAELHAEVRVLLADDRRRLECGQKLRVARGARRVPVDGVGARLPLRVGELHHVDDAISTASSWAARDSAILRAGAARSSCRTGRPAWSRARGWASRRTAAARSCRAGRRACTAPRRRGSCARLERVVADAELQQVGAHPLLVGLQVLDARGVRLHAGAVAA